MNIIVGCEESGIVRDALIERGHNAVSCDILASRRPGPHHQGDIFGIANDGWDMGIFFPPCTRLCVSGARWFAQYKDEQEAALEFVRKLMALPYPKAIENPIGVISSRIRKPDQIIQPWMFGHGETKATCLWLDRLPKLTPTNIVSGREARIHRMAPGINRARDRSETFSGIANAMAAQWG